MDERLMILQAKKISEGAVAKERLILELEEAGLTEVKVKSDQAGIWSGTAKFRGNDIRF